MRRLVPDLFFGGKGGLQRNMAAAMAGCKARMGRVLGAAVVMRMMRWRAGRARGADIALSDKRLGVIYARAKQRGPCIRRAQTAFGRCRCHWTMRSAENRYGNESMVPSGYSGAAAGTPHPPPDPPSLHRHRPDIGACEGADPSGRPAQTGWLLVDFRDPACPTATGCAPGTSLAPGALIFSEHGHSPFQAPPALRRLSVTITLRNPPLR